MQNAYEGLDWLCALCKLERVRWKMRGNFKAPFLSLQNSIKATSQVNHQPQPLSFSNNAKEPCITATDHLRHPQLTEPIQQQSKKKSRLFFSLCFYVKESNWMCDLRRWARRWKAAGTRHHERLSNSFLILPLRQEHNTQHYYGVWL